MIHKPHAWVELSQTALENNLAQLKKIEGDALLAPVVKGNAYGHGLTQVGRVCQKSPHVDWACVASLSEALTLRKVGFSKPILILVYLDDDPKLVVENEIDVLVYTTQNLQELNDCAQKLNKPCNIHIKIDTGLSRFGFCPDEAVAFVKKLQQFPLINLRGIATHFAQSEVPDQQFTHKQIELFETTVKKIEALGINIPFKHASNSAAALRFTPKIGNLFRLGIGTYGYWSSEHVKKLAQKVYPEIALAPVLSLKTRIFSIRTIPAGRSVGYGRTYETKKETVLATIPTGYVDGYSRKLANKGNVFVRGQHAPIVGAIGMNTTTIDVTHIPNLQVGDEVTLIGDHPGIRASDLAQAADLNLREITTRIDPTIKRRLV